MQQINGYGKQPESLSSISRGRRIELLPHDILTERRLTLLEIKMGRAEEDIEAMKTERELLLDALWRLARGASLVGIGLILDGSLNKGELLAVIRQQFGL